MAQATPEQISRIKTLAQSIGTEPSAGVLLVEIEERADDQSAISIPGDIHDFPWVGQSVFLRFDPDPVHAVSSVFSVRDEPTDRTVISGRVYRNMPVPRIRTKTGKRRNVFSLTRYLELSPKLSSVVTAMCPEHPQEILSAILWNGRLEPPEPIDQLRIGTSAAWIQSPEWQYCKRCRKRMRLIVQVPGPCADRKEYREGTLYLFGCAEHARETKGVVQFS